MNKFLLRESNRDNMLLPYVELCRQRGIDMNVSKMKQLLLEKFVNEANIRNLSLASNYYLAGVAKYYFNGDLTSNKELNVLNPNVTDKFDRDICQRLSALILILRNSYIDSVGTKFEQPEDFGELSLKKLLRKYGAAIDKELGIVRQKKERKQNGPVLDENPRVGNGYTFDILYSYNDARKYNQYTEPGAWCITYGEHHYNAYIRRLNIHYVIFLKDGYENVPRRKGPNFTPQKPQDEYGNSMIALLQSNVNGEPVYITSRWNHGSYSDDSSCEADHAYTKEEFLRVVGMDDSELQRIFKIWKANKEKKHASNGGDRSALNAERLNVLRQFKYAQMRINGGDQNPFDDVKISNGIAFTGIEKLQNIKDKALSELNDLEDSRADEETINAFKERYQKVYDKAFKDTVRACEVKLNEGKYFFLIDKSKILFETIVKADSNLDDVKYHFFGSDIGDSWNTSKAKFFKNIVRCDVVNGIMLYNTRLHDFINIDGKKKFKFVTEPIEWEVKDAGPGSFYEIKMSSQQMALVNYDTNKPLKLPNGSCWFESISYPGKRSYYSHEIRLNFIKNKKVFEIMYDSASGEKYIYDVNTKQFLNLENKIVKRQEDGAEIVLKPYIYSLGENKYGIYGIKWSVNDYTNRYDIVKLYKDGKEVENANPDYGYKAVKYSGNGIFILVYPCQDILLFDIETRRIYKVPECGDIKFGIGYGENNRDDNRLCTLIGYGSHEIFFDTKYKQWIKNPLNGLYVFHIWSSSYDETSLTVYTDEVDSNGNEVSKKVRMKLKDDAPEYEITGNVNENKITITHNDIRNMVKESINKIMRPKITINESDIRNMVKSALMETLFAGFKKNPDGSFLHRFDDDGIETDEYKKARWEDPAFDEYEKGDEEEDMWLRHGNKNLEDTHGALGMASLDRIKNAVTEAFRNQLFDEKHTFEVAFVYFINEKDDYGINVKELIKTLESIRGIDVEDYYLDDDGDWNIECVAEVQCGQEDLEAIDAKLKDMLSPIDISSWDYHYIRGIDNDFYWQP